MLEDWFVGIRDDLRPFERTLDPAFCWVGPDGVIREGDEIVAALSTERTNVKGADGPVSLNIDAIEHHRDRYGLHLITFEKRLQVGSNVDARTCSVWLAETDRSPTGLAWLHLHETPLVSDEQS